MQAPFCLLMRLRVERRKRRAKSPHLIRAESNRGGERDRCVRDEISNDERASTGSCWNINSRRNRFVPARRRPTCAKREKSSRTAVVRSRQPLRPRQRLRIQ